MVELDEHLDYKYREKPGISYTLYKNHLFGSFNRTDVCKRSITRRLVEQKPL